ncbi:hypothetical protein [Nostoc sp. ATCC 53789]|uniref:hypothetical protein n=1 Tax=Nostoc sp. ATCC 53789 TaxID=76335 RepID=UPI001431D46B|nr:hypothetical protein [Nostoc sp. ATCC 53789]
MLSGVIWALTELHQIGITINGTIPAHRTNQIEVAPIVKPLFIPCILGCPKRYSFETSPQTRISHDTVGRGVWGVWGVRFLPHPPTPPTPPTLLDLSQVKNPGQNGE